MFQIWGYNEKQTKIIKMQKSSKKKKEKKVHKLSFDYSKNMKN